MHSPKSNSTLNYVIVTPARNEEDNIERVISSMIRQTYLPAKWVIVSDGSTDRTDAIIKAYLPDHPWIEMVRTPEHADRQFAAKVNCFNAGYNRLSNTVYDVIGNLDADISFEADYFESLISKFENNANLGVAGTPFIEDGSAYDYRFTNIEHVSGACQLFRRACFEEIGGYMPIKGGGIDWVAVTTARMKGWETRTFTDQYCYHHRKIGTGNVNRFLACFKQGQKDYFLGNHPLWEIFRAVYQMGKKPLIINGLLILIGYVWAGLNRTEIVISQQLKSFIRQEQMQRLQKTLSPF